MDDLEAVQALLPVSRETGDRLGIYVALLRKWQPVQNLISPLTLDHIWQRHIADSAQLVAMFPTTRTWLDLGSGAGLPGAITAILLAEHSDAVIHCVESNQRKCAFLRTVVRETGAPLRVQEGRIDSVLQRWAEPVERISARALAPLDQLIGWTASLIARGSVATLHKGEDFDSELAQASKSWSLDLVRHKSMIDASSTIVEIGRAERLG